MSTETDIYADMEEKEVLDSEGERLGRIFDVVMDKSLTLKYFVTRYGKHIYLIEPDMIGSVTDIVKLNCPREQVKVFEHEDPKWISFTTLRTKQVYDRNGENIGVVEDIIFHNDNKVSFVIGGKGLRGYLSFLGFGSDRMLVPYRHIKEVNQYNIELHTAKEDLEKMFRNRPLDMKTYLSYEARRKSSEETEIQLHRDTYTIYR